MKVTKSAVYFEGINQAAGPYLLEENKTHGGCPDGEARINGGYRLPAKHVISTVGPRGENPNILRKAYISSLNKIKEARLKSIALPCVSTGNLLNSKKFQF